MGTPIPKEPDGENLILDPTLDDPTKWISGFEWTIVGGEGVYVNTSPTGGSQLRNLSNLELDKQYLVRVVMDNVDFDPADEIRLRVGNQNIPLPHTAGTHDIITIATAFVPTRVNILPLVVVGRGQTMNVQSIHVWSTVGLDVTKYNIIAWRDQFFDNFNLGGSEGMSFYAGQRFQTRIWIKRG